MNWSEVIQKSTDEEGRLLMDLLSGEKPNYERWYQDPFKLYQLIGTIIIPAVLVIVGLIGNSLIIAVLKDRKTDGKRTSATLLLIFIAVVDCIQLPISYMVSFSHIEMFHISKVFTKFRRGWIWYYMGTVFALVPLENITNTVDSFLTLYLGVDRFMHLRFPLFSRKNNMAGACKKALAVILCASVCLALPQFFAYRITLILTETLGPTGDVYTETSLIQNVGLLGNKGTVVYMTTLIVLTSFIPVILLTILNILILANLRTNRNHSKVTRMVLANLGTTLIGKYPNAVRNLLILANFENQERVKYAVNLIGPTATMLYFSEKALNCITYCFAGSDFRKALFELLGVKTGGHSEESPADNKAADGANKTSQKTVVPKGN